MTDDPIKWLVQMVQQQDRDRYLCAMFVPKEQREAVFAILALHAEIARIRETTSEPLIAAMRFQTWRDGLDNDELTPSALGNPIVKEIRQLPIWLDLKPHILRILDVRQDDMDFQPFSDAKDAEVWLRRVTEPLIAALLLACAGKSASAVPLPTALTDAFLAHGLFGVLRATHGAISNGLPLWKPDMGDTEVRQQIVKDVAARGAELVLTAREAQADVSRSAFPLLLHAALARQHAKALRKANHEIFDQRFYGLSRLGTAVLWSALRKKI